MVARHLSPPSFHPTQELTGRLAISNFPLFQFVHQTQEQMARQATCYLQPSSRSTHPTADRTSFHLFVYSFVRLLFFSCCFVSIALPRTTREAVHLVGKEVHGVGVSVCERQRNLVSAPHEEARHARDGDAPKITAVHMGDVLIPKGGYLRDKEASTEVSMFSSARRQRKAKDVRPRIS